ncbi:hypothetical protein PG984_006237 [Apiospora sp. TS-2023a]
MEIAASVTGILAFAGQALSGLVTLRSFVEAFKNAPEETRLLLGHINDLHAIIDNSRHLIKLCDDVDDPSLRNSLGIQGKYIEACSKEVSHWQQEWDLNTATSTPASWKGVKKRFLQAVDKDTLQVLSRRLSAQRERINLHLSLLGRIYDQLSWNRRAALETRFERFERDFDSMSERLSSIHSSVGSIASNLSVADNTSKLRKKRSTQQLAKTQNLLHVPNKNTAASNAARKVDLGVNKCSVRKDNKTNTLGSVGTDSLPTHKAHGLDGADDEFQGKHWSCDALTGIDDAFEHNQDTGKSCCLFCGRVFLWHDDEESLRQGIHLVADHGFGKCCPGVLYHKIEDITKHLGQFHQLGANELPLLRLLARPSTPTTESRGSWPDSKPVTLGIEIDEMLRLLPQLDGLLSAAREARDDGDLEWNKTHRDWSDPTQYHATRSSMAYGYIGADNFPICSNLATLDDEILWSTLRVEEYLDICYNVACLQEQLVVAGFECLSSEAYLSRSQFAVVQLLSKLKPEEQPIRRFNNKWTSLGNPVTELLSHSMKPSIQYFNTPSGAMISYYGFFQSCYSRELLGAELKEARLGLRRKISTSPMQPQMDRENSSLSRENIAVAGQNSCDTSRRIDAWLLGNFAFSIPTRRLLMSGKVRLRPANIQSNPYTSPGRRCRDDWEYLPMIPVTSPTLFAQKLISCWSKTSDFTRPSICESLEVRRGGYVTAVKAGINDMRAQHPGDGTTGYQGSHEFDQSMRSSGY